MNTQNRHSPAALPMNRPVPHPYSLRCLPAAALAALLLVVAPGQLAAQDRSPDTADARVATTEQPRTDPYADAPIIEAPEASGMNSFVDGLGAAAPTIALSNMPGAPVVVELFTSQGCNSCPPADAMLADLAQDPDVLPLSFHVDYWDYLGWKDAFASPEFTRRQQGYARSVGERAVYTPQIIVGGQDTAPSIQPVELMGMIDAHRTSPALVSVTDHIEGDRQVVELTPLSDLGGSVAVILVRFAPSRTVEVKAGENSGRSITYLNVVLDMARLADWDGRAPLRLTIGGDAASGQDFPPDTRHAILIQRMSGAKGQMPGAILTALTLD
ncbi:DUF1223 domain-containing protein [Paracoccus tegillarcae]|uniref:DUF1223 domain-containing protein n=1 Tax=Paracoccus tegillarcae TaxID=1529068 RepID=A0A2K9EG39_9RHOB|nr:DUF1223 domain-containing protein [Paracoccus tegillarcae]AUH33928.1 DUF1223 domain-containing protein [Paracoccus tegillarcae]